MRPASTCCALAEPVAHEVLKTPHSGIGRPRSRPARASSLRGESLRSVCTDGARKEPVPRGLVTRAGETPALQSWNGSPAHDHATTFIPGSAGVPARTSRLMESSLSSHPCADRQQESGQSTASQCKPCSDKASVLRACCRTPPPLDTTSARSARAAVTARVPSPLRISSSRSRWSVRGSRRPDPCGGGTAGRGGSGLPGTEVSRGTRRADTASTNHRTGSGRCT